MSIEEVVLVIPLHPEVEMTSLQRKSLALAAATLLVASCQAPPADTVVEEAPYRAETGDTVWILLNHVRSDQTENFERFIEEALRPALEQASAQDSLYANILSRGRMLYPVRQNSDSTYTYMYVMEHHIPGDYSYARLLRTVYTPEEADEYLSIPAEALARPQETYFVIQRW